MYNLWQVFEGWFWIWQKFKRIWQILNSIGPISIFVNEVNISKIIPSGHTGQNQMLLQKAAHFSLTLSKMEQFLLFKRHFLGIAKNLLNIWSTFAWKFVAKTFSKMPKLLTLNKFDLSLAVLFSFSEFFQRPILSSKRTNMKKETLRRRRRRRRRWGLKI